MILEKLVAGRLAGFVVVSPDGEGGRVDPPGVASPAAFRARVEKAVAEAGVTDRARKRAATKIGRAFGQVPERRVRTEFMRVTTAIGHPEFTRVHDLRHLFCSRAQEKGMNPILVQNVLGHTTLDMTRRYSHLGIDTAREALEKLSPSVPSQPMEG
jgi:site-specific recombinase XerD